LFAQLTADDAAKEAQLQRSAAPTAESRRAVAPAPADVGAAPAGTAEPPSDDAAGSTDAPAEALADAAADDESGDEAGDDATDRVPLPVRLLEWLDAPLAGCPDWVRDAVGKVAILTFVNAVAVLIY